MPFPSTLELESGGHEELEIYREAYNAKISFVESCETWSADVTPTDIRLEKGFPYKYSGNITYNNLITEYKNIYVSRFLEKIRGSDVWVDVDPRELSRR